MSFEVLEQLESRIQALVDAVGMKQLELEELRDMNEGLSRENESLRQEQQNWQDRLRSLLGKMEEVE